MPRRINLALQGGGAHGAFTWGVLDRLLEDDTIEIAGISGASAGALNGAALKSGLLSGGRQGARENLDWLWRRVGAIGDLRLTGWLTTFAPPPGAISQAIENSLPYGLADAASRVFSPYEWTFLPQPIGKNCPPFQVRSGLCFRRACLLRLSYECPQRKDQGL